MKKLNQLMQEIITLTANIENNYPELYKYLDETPFTICPTEKKDICVADLEEYLDTLKTQLKDHILSHSTRKK